MVKLKQLVSKSVSLSVFGGWWCVWGSILEVDFGLPQLVLLPPDLSSGVPFPPHRRQQPLLAPAAPLPDFFFFNDLPSREPLFIKAVPSLPSPHVNWGGLMKVRFGP